MKYFLKYNKLLIEYFYVILSSFLYTNIYFLIFLKHQNLSNQFIFNYLKFAIILNFKNIKYKTQIYKI